MNSRGGNNNSSMNGGGSGNAIDTVENKYFLWSFLDEEKVFDGITGENMQSVVNIFETAINTVKNSHLSVDSNNNNSDAPVVSAASLAAMNKEVVQRMVVEIPRYKFNMQAHAPAPKATTLEMRTGFSTVFFTSTFSAGTKIIPPSVPEI